MTEENNFVIRSKLDLDTSDKSNKAFLRLYEDIDWILKTSGTPNPKATREKSWTGRRIKIGLPLDSI